MKRFIVFLSVFFIFNSATAQINSSLSFGTDATFDVVTWNIEHFPKNSTTTLNYVEAIILELDAEIIAFQEIDDGGMFIQLANRLSDYAYYQNESLRYLYKKSEVTINNRYSIFSGYSDPFPREPFVLDVDFKGDNYIIINNHLKCCDGSEDRRYTAMEMLKEYIDDLLPNDNVIVVGDMNDVLEDDYADNVFRNILADTDNYLYTDLVIANGSSSHWSYPSWPSHLDHILITNDLFDEFEDGGSHVEVIEIDDYLSNGWSEYYANVSDHRPVGIRFLPNSAGTEDITDKFLFNNYPNPFKNSTTFSFSTDFENRTIEIYNFSGQKIYSETLLSSQKTLIWENDILAAGIYFARLLSNNNEVASLKLVVE